MLFYTAGLAALA